MTDREIKAPPKRLQICPECGGYMRAISAFDGTGKKEWHHQGSQRSFGGVELRRFVCEKCRTERTFQVDDLIGSLSEDD